MYCILYVKPVQMLLKPTLFFMYYVKLRQYNPKPFFKKKIVLFDFTFVLFCIILYNLLDRSLCIVSGF